MLHDKGASILMEQDLMEQGLQADRSATGTATVLVGSRPRFIARRRPFVRFETHQPTSSLAIRDLSTGHTWLRTTNRRS